MVKNWELNLIRPTAAVTVALRLAWADTMRDLHSWMESELVPALVHGGRGIQGIAETPFYKFISSDNGLSQLGIEKTEPPRLLQAYQDSMKVSHNNTMVFLRFGDVARLKLGTPHPANGTGLLQVESWLDWIIDGVNVNSGFVPRTKLPKSAQKNIRISSAPGGLMLPKGLFGSTGLWRFPTRYKDYDVRWVANNVGGIEKAITNKAVFLLSQHLK